VIITAGIYKGRKLAVPDESITRPTLSKVRMGVFNMLYSVAGEFEGKSFLDVFGGSGVMGLEALSRGFSKVTVFEKNPKAVRVIKKNYISLGIKPDLKTGDSLKLIDKSMFYDVVYIDPPYQSGIYESILEKAKGDILIVEHSSALDFKGFEILRQKNYGGKIVTFLRSV